MTEEAPKLSETQAKKLDAGDASLQRLLLNWVQTNDAADKITVGDLKKLTMLLRQFTRAVSIEHYGHGFRDGAEEGGRLLVKELERQEAIDSPAAVDTATQVTGEVMKAVEDVNRNARKGGRH
ncbi:MAG: hypothetical protein IPO08_21960 [Xanthomonadales bacterium]|nr:hypothetical protein [Xanthomonadales bacterium]